MAVPQTFIDRVNDMADERSLSRSQLLRELVELGIEAMQRG
jgi:hypothetical protein